MKWRLIFISTLVLLIINLPAYGQYSQNVGTFLLELNSSGQITSLSDAQSNFNYMAKEPSFLVGIKVYDEVIYPVAMKTNKDILDFSFANGSTVSVKATNKKQYLRFEIISVISRDEVDAILWEITDIISNRRYCFLLVAFTETISAI